ncbi:MAG TPA: globin domain-containing protein [Phycisphaerae bacterium]|mgnify:CR=1 FL=1|nr:hemin receptor [Phycisphaerales bacterium]HRX83956.1 globin domain-containing protein [Phycisphaerae bacterium]
MNQATIERLEQSFKLIAPRSEELVDRFYAHLFSAHPDVRAMFPQEMTDQKMRLLSSIVRVVQNLRTLDRIQPALVEMGRRHVDYGVKPAHYPIVRDTLIAVMQEIAGDKWEPEYTADWTAALNLVAEVMLQGQAQTTTGKQ